MTLVLAAIAAMFCKDMTLIAQMQQSPVIMVTTQDDAATLTTVTTIGTTVGVILHMAQMHRPTSALT